MKLLCAQMIEPTSARSRVSVRVCWSRQLLHWAIEIFASDLSSWSFIAASIAAGKRWFFRQTRSGSQGGIAWCAGRNEAEFLKIMSASTSEKKKKKKATDKDKTERLGEVLEFMRLLWAVDHALQSTSKRMEVSLGVTGPQRLVIRIVGRFPQISAGELADVLHIHPSTLTGVLKRLEARGIIDRKVDSGDARRALFSLTAKGKDVDALRNGTVESTVRKALAKIPARKVVAARDVLQELANTLIEDQE